MIDLFFTGIIVSFVISLVLTFYFVYLVIKKMSMANRTGIDVNKLDKPKIPEMGGIAAFFAITLSMSISVGFVKIIDEMSSEALLVAVSVMGLAALVGVLDDVSILGRREKAWLISFASLPLIISQISNEKLDFLILVFDFSTENHYKYLFWFLIVPFGISACSNAINMSAGYNGLESGQMAIISINLLIISLINNADLIFCIIFSSVFGSCLGLYYFNRFPARIFIGDVGTLSFGSLVAATLIMSNQIIFGIICIIPTFFELFATVKYSFKGIERRGACMSPDISPSGEIRPPPGSEDYTLAFQILSRFPSNEKVLVQRLLLLYLFSGILAIIIAYNF